MSTELFQRAEVDWIPLVIFVLWALSGLFGNKKRKQRRAEEAGEIPPPRQRTEQVERGGANAELQEVLREIERDLGLTTEKSESRPPLVLPGPEQPRGPWHAAPSPLKKASRKARALHEKSLMPPREAHVHDHSDSSQLRQSREVPSKLASELLGDLTGGGANLQKAILLQEILGPPVSLREFD